MESNQIEQARFLRDRHRYEESEAMLLVYLSACPDSAEGHCELALTRMSMSGRKKDALESIEKAIGLAPDNAWMQAVRSFAFCDLEKFDKALKSADEAIAADAMCDLAWIAKARSLGGKERWKEAEAAVRKSLEIDPNNSQANNLLSVYLRVQGKTQEANLFTDLQLSQDAEDPFALSNAGWTRLHESKYKEAERLFLEALRLDPEQEYARQGLREAYKTRSVFYRLYLKWALFMQRFEGRSQTLIIISLFIGYKVFQSYLSEINPAFAITLALIYMLFIFWVWLASGVGHFILLLDKRARLSLNKQEKLDGSLVGGSFLGGLAFMLMGLIPSVSHFMGMGVSMVVSAIPLSLVALNESKIGVILFGLFGALGISLGALTVITYYTMGKTTDFFYISILLAFITTWIAMIPGLRK